MIMIDVILSTTTKRICDHLIVNPFNLQEIVKVTSSMRIFLFHGSANQHYHAIPVKKSLSNNIRSLG